MTMIFDSVNPNLLFSIEHISIIYSDTKYDGHPKKNTHTHPGMFLIFAPKMKLTGPMVLMELANTQIRDRMLLIK